MPVPLSRVLEAWRHDPKGVGLLATIAAPLSRALDAIIANPRTMIARTHEQLPPHKVREMDTRSLQKLARLPGYTVRQKLASTRHVRAPVRYKSCDTTDSSTNAFGRFQTRFTMPTLPALVGQEITGQAVIQDGAGFLISNPDCKEVRNG